jgi:uncharacterized protein YjbI with pentapeptide repeats
MILQRLWDREKFPRKLWYPYYPEEPLDEEEWQAQFSEVSDILRNSMFIVLGYAGFCAVTLGQSDEQILKTAGFTLPVIGSTVSVKGFMQIGPLILNAVTFYLHIFLGLWHTLRGDRTDKNLRPPYMFNLANRTAANLAFFIFYWLPPIILFAFARKGSPFIDGEIITYYAALDWLEIKLGLYFQNSLSLLPLTLACISTIAISMLAIRRRPTSQRDKNRVYWAALPVLVVLLFASWFNPFWVRPLDLARSDFSSKDLRNASLISANLFHSNLQGADLRNANLKGAKISYANLVGAKLSSARISKANLEFSDLSKASATSVLFTGSNLGDAELINADLSGATLHMADLTNADLTDADLTEASLRRAKLASANLTGTKLSGADLSFTDLSEANLSQATLTNANLRNADIEGADLAFAGGLTCTQVQQAVGKPKALPATISKTCYPKEKPGSGFEENSAA